MVAHPTSPDGGRQPVPTREPVSIGRGGADELAIGADIVRMMAVQTEGLGGATWNRWSWELHQFGRNTVLSYARDRSLLARIAAIGERVSVPLRHIVDSDSDQARRDLAEETVAEALGYWQRVVMPQQRWEPRSQVSTLFIRTCLLRASRAASRVSLDRPLTEADLVVHQSLEPMGDDPVRRVIARDELVRAAELIQALPPTDRALLMASASEVPQSQLAAELGTTVRGVEGRLHRIRDKLHRQLDIA